MDLDPDPLSFILLLVNAAVSVADSSWIVFNLPTLGSLIAILVAIMGLLLSSFFSGSEIAYFSLKPDQINGIEDNESRERVKALLAKPEKLLATILIGNNIANVVIVVLLNYAVSKIMVINNGVADFVIQTILFTFLILLFGEVLPKLYASNNNVKFAQFAAHGLSTAMSLLSPLSRLMVKSTRIVDRVVTTHADDLSVDDLSRALEASNVKSGEEKDILEGILTFGDKTVNEIMRPRVDVVALDMESTFGDVVKCVVENGYSRMPVYEDSLDNIKGILYAKDLLPYIGKMDDAFQWQKLLRGAYFVPETRMIDDLLEDFRKKKIHLAVVVDEFGCTQGIATMEDVLEEIVGDIDDEYDDEQKFYTKINDDTFVFDGKTSIGDFCRVTDLDEEVFDNDAVGEAETIAGLLLNIKGDFLKQKEAVDYKNCHFEVLKVVKYRIAKVRVHIDRTHDEEKQ
ncbi:MAG: gliding motility-associated protein GldE [Muribaculaceae bacterium]|nr:gliding motility-associated protein GldE [Muribaculaceae bacterium]